MTSFGSLPRTLAGALRHPRRALHVLAWRWRQDPARLLDRVASGLPTPIRRPLPRLIAWYGRLRTRDGSAELWSAGHWAQAVSTVDPSSARGRRYAGEIAAARDAAMAVPTRIAADGGAPAAARILHVVSNALPYTQAGYTIRTHSVVRAQRSAGLDPHVVTRWGWPALNGVLDAGTLAELDGVPYHRLPPSGPIPDRADARMARNAAALDHLVARLRPAMIHAATPFLNGAPALAAAHRAGLPLVYEVRGFQEDTWACGGSGRELTDRYRWIRDAETRVCLQADAVVTLAETMGRELVARGVPDSKIVIVPNAVDDSLLSAHPDGVGVRRRLGIQDREFVVGSVSSLTDYEGFATLLEALAAVRRDGIAVRGLLVGQGPAATVLKQLRARLGLDRAVLIHPPVPQDVAPAAVAALDLMCVPRVDARVCRIVTPLKIVEGMALGVPVIASDLPALSEVLLGGSAGLLVPPDDPAALADAVVRLHRDPDLRRELAQAGRAAVAAGRTWQAAAGKYRDLYHRLSPGRAVADPPNEVRVHP